jgi:hypothetical protein
VTFFVTSARDPGTHPPDPGSRAPRPQEGESVKPPTKRNIESGAWERSIFAMTAADLEIHEAVMAMSRLLDGDSIGPISRRALRFALNALQVESQHGS